MEPLTYGLEVFDLEGRKFVNWVGLAQPAVFDPAYGWIGVYVDGGDYYCYSLKNVSRFYMHVYREGERYK